MIPAVFWQDIEAAGGMYTGAEVLQLINMRTGKHAILSHLRQQAHLLSVKRGTAYIYPRFQFDPETHLIRPVIADLIKLAADARWTQEELLVWLCSPSGHFRGHRPAEHVDHPDNVLDAARQAATIQW
ncbi:hypothetical protein [Cryobacterium sp. Y57]|uniref:hypothetical protein n=1 Tax=Cryobacterium sp. Y57 TaxID=2048287 RepID=UPI000CE3626A|nr:hypothetical protein [Cryobacterium sp. Y57]